MTMLARPRIRRLGASALLLPLRAGPVLAAAGLADFVLFYLLACAWLHLRRARPARSVPS